MRNPTLNGAERAATLEIEEAFCRIMTEFSGHVDDGLLLSAWGRVAGEAIARMKSSYNGSTSPAFRIGCLQFVLQGAMFGLSQTLGEDECS